MKKYQIQSTIGSGNFSTVYKGVSLPDHLTCAIKVMKAHHEIATRQALTLKKFKHPNIVSIIDFEQSSNQSRIVLQYVGMNTLQLYQTHSHGLKEEQVKCILFQTALGLSCVHSHGVIHRDIKPQNILIDKKSAIVKIVDFGLAIDQNKCETDYIATRWYRAPENLLGTKQYTCAIDVFSLGCVIVQLFISSALFPGSNNIDQIYKIFSILGYPSSTSWPKGYQKLLDLGIKPKNEIKNQLDLKSIMNPCDPRLIEIIEKMLQINPKKRITCIQILRHQYFKQIKGIIPPIVYQRFQQDIMNNPRSLSFKSLYTVKSYKNLPIQKKFYKKSSTKLPQNFNVKQKQIKNIQRPQFLRQKKSTSLDSHKIKQNYPISKLAADKQRITNIDSLKRKTSTPSLFLPNQPLNHRKIPSVFLKQKNKTVNLCDNQKFFDKSKNSSEIIIEDSTLQMKDSNLTPNLSQTTTMSKIFTPTSFETQKKFSAFVTQAQNFKNILYPLIPNVKLVNDIEDQGIYSKTARNLPSKNIQMSNQFHIQINPTSYQSHDLTRNYKKDQNVTDISRNLSINLGFQCISTSYSPAQNIQKTIEVKSRDEFNKKQLKNQDKDQTASPKYFNSNSNLFKSQQRKLRVNINQRIPHKQINSYKPFLSPSHRYFCMSPQNKFVANGRHNRLVLVNSIPHEFVSPLHRKI